MSVRLLTTRLVKHGRYLLQTYWKRDIHTNILEQNQTRNTRQQRLPSVAAAAGRVSGKCSSTQKFQRVFGGEKTAIKQLRMVIGWLFQSKISLICHLLPA